MTLDSPTPPPAGSTPPFEEVCAQCLELFETEGSKALERACADYPQYADELRATVDNLVTTGLVTPSPAELEFPERLGEFKLHEQVGVGGMGVVYRAEQVSLGRQVALKLIRPEYLFFPGAKERLQREVEAVARLDHPGIVSILTVGEHGELPFFAMEFINGVSLADVIDDAASRDPAQLTGTDFHETVRRLCKRDHRDSDPFGVPSLFRGSWWEVCVRIVRQVAEALEHAHGRGIVHRDVKPSNAMVTPDGRVLVVDFGLALLQASPKLTRSGTTLGSLAYMAPEQLRHDEKNTRDHRVDVYSLGVTLYELLTLRPAFTGRDVAELQKYILDTDCPTPRTINSTVPRDLETVCRTAVNREPTSRYESAAAFAHDLTNVLERRPIRAHRPSALLRALRWVQRHRAVSVAIFLGLMLVVGLPLTLYLQQKAATRRIQEEANRAERNLDTALETVRQLLLRLADEKLKLVPGTRAIRERLNRDALALLRRLEDSHEAPFLEARVLVVLADVLRESDRIAECLSALEEAFALWRPLIKALPISERTFIATAYRLRGMSRLYQGKLDLAESDLQEARRRRELLVAEDGKNVSWRNALWMIHSSLGRLAMDRNQAQQATREFERCLEIVRRIHRQDPSHVATNRLVMTLTNLARITLAKSPKRARSALEEALRLSDSLQQGPKPGRDPFLAARVHQVFGLLLRSQGDFTTAEKHLVESVRYAEQFLSDNPDLPVALSDLGAKLNDLSIAVRNRRRYEEAARHAERARGLQARAVKLAPDVLEFRVFLRNHLGTLIMALLPLDQPRKLAAAAEDLGSMRTRPRFHVFAARALLHAVRKARQKPDRDIQREKRWIDRAIGFLKQEEAESKTFHRLLGDKVFELVSEEPEGREVLARLRSRRK